MANGISRIKVAKVTLSGKKGSALEGELSSELNSQEFKDEVGVNGKRHAKRSRKK